MVDHQDTPESQERTWDWQAYIDGLDEATVRREFLAMVLRSETPNMIRALEARAETAEGLVRETVVALREVERLCERPWATGNELAILREVRPWLSRAQSIGTEVEHGT